MNSSWNKAEEIIKSKLINNRFALIEISFLACFSEMHFMYTQATNSWLHNTFAFKRSHEFNRIDELELLKYRQGFHIK